MMVSPIGVTLNGRPKYVVSTSLTDPQWAGTSVVARRRRRRHPRADGAARRRTCWFPAAALLVRGLLANGLVDQLDPPIYPVIIGQGTRLFSDSGPGHRARTGQLADHFARRHHPDVSDYRPPGVRKSGGRPERMKTSALTQADADRLHEAMAARVENRSLPGIVTLVAQGDDVYVDVIGAMAFGGDRPMRRDTIFRITSMTKPILGAATMLLVDDGRLAGDEPVSRLLPELAARRVLKRVDGPLDQTVPANRPITVEDLLTFRPGYGFIIVEPTTFNPPYPIIQRAEELSSPWRSRTPARRTTPTSGSPASQRCR